MASDTTEVIRVLVAPPLLSLFRVTREVKGRRAGHYVGKAHSATGSPRVGTKDSRQQLTVTS